MTPSRRPRLVATDLDGTLLGPDGSISERTRDVLAAVADQGVPVVFVTGRPWRWLAPLADVPGHPLAICSNGTIVFDVAEQAVTQAHPFDPDGLLDLGRRLRRGVPGTAFAVEKVAGLGREPGFLDRHREDGVPVGALEELVDASVIKLLATHDELAPETYWEQVVEHARGLGTATRSAAWTLVEISPPGITKQTTLAELCADLAVDAADVIAFGDMPNDVDMLRWAGSSWAMSDGHPLARSAADGLAPANTDDGVARVLTTVFGLGSGL